MRLAPLLLLGSLSACAGGPGPGGLSTSSSSSSGNASSSGGGSGAVTAFYRDYFRAYCGQGERCAATNGRTYTSQAACEEGYNDPLFTAFARQFEAIYTLDSVKAAQCLTAIGMQACNDTSQPASCLDAAIPKHPAAIGEACAFDAPCPRNGYCNNCDMCVALKANGLECDYGGQCQSGNCDYQAGGAHCAPAPAPTVLPGRGEPCPNGACAGYFECVAGAEPRTCQERANVGQACSESAQGRFPDCLNDLVCSPASAGSSEGTCVARLPDGATCSRNSGTNRCEHYCRFPAKDSAQGTCVAIQSDADVPGPGEPCLGGFFCAFDENVTTRSIQGEQGQVSCECVSRAQLGGTCFADSECREGYCRGGSTTAPGTSGTCSPRLADGAQCASYNECSSGSCDFSQTPAVCAVPMCL